MGPRVELEDIEGLRREAGIDDGELREQVRRLRAGDSVRLTAATAGGPGPRDRLLVRITNVRGSVFRGSLVHTSGDYPARLKTGSPLTFRASHIHSIVGKGHGEASDPAPGRSEPQREGASVIASTNAARPPSGRRSLSPPLTTERRLREIEELLRRVAGYAEFMCRAGGLEGTSPEARDRAVAAFHERMAAMERHLGRVHDEFRLE